MAKSCYTTQMGINLRKAKMKGKSKTQRSQIFKKAAKAAKRKCK